MNARDLGKGEGRRRIEDEENAEDDELLSVGLFLKPGDVAALDAASGSGQELAVFVQQLGDYCQFVTANGRWRHKSLRNIDHVIQGYIDPALLQPLLPFLPTTPDPDALQYGVNMPRDLAAPVTTILDLLVHESERIYRENATVLDNAYATLADKTRIRIMTQQQIARLLLAPGDRSYVPTPAALLALRKALKQAPFKFTTDKKSHRMTNIYTIRPMSDVHVIETVHGWVREYEEHRAMVANRAGGTHMERTEGAQHIFDFAAKASRLIRTSRQFRDPLVGSVSPNQSKNQSKTVYGEPFSTSDQKIIRFMQTWAVNNEYHDAGGLFASATTIMAATNAYSEATLRDTPSNDALHEEIFMRRRDMAFVMLQEMGVLTPYENKVIYDESLQLPTIRLSRNVELLNAKVELMRKNPDFRDSMTGLRKDWESLEVYCIDNADAQEIDDGISISKVEGKPSEHWIHVHVANPTAFFDKTHVLSGLAAHMVETVYLPESTFPMLPTWASLEYFSIAPNRPVLTISTRVDSSGAVLERKMQPGIVRRVNQLTYNDVVEAMGETSPQMRHIIVGGKLPPTETKPRPDLTSSQLQDLKDLYTVARSLFARRRAAGALRSPNRNSNVNVHEKSGASGLTWRPPSIERARFIADDPIIDLPFSEVEGTITTEIDSSNIVEEMMMLACTTAGAWCAERNIPLIYRGTIETPDRAFTPQQLEEKISHFLDKGEPIPSDLLALYNGSRRALIHSSPIAHDIIKAPSYVRVTSPLRRFSDMIAHWQIEAAVRYEARTGLQFDASATDAAANNTSLASHLSFSPKQIRDSILTLSPREQTIKKANRESRRHWVLSALQRALFYNQTSSTERFPPTFKVTVTSSEVFAIGQLNIVSAMIEEIGLRTWMAVPDKAVKWPKEGEMHEGKFEAHDEWEAKITSINLYRAKVVMEPVRLIRRGAVAVDGEEKGLQSA